MFSKESRLNVTIARIERLLERALEFERLGINSRAEELLREAIRLEAEAFA